MKIRSGFISNSSSSSFVIDKRDLTEDQIEEILNNDFSDQQFGKDTGDDWYISDAGNTVRGYVSMDNYSMSDFFDKIGVPRDVIEWDEFPF